MLRKCADIDQHYFIEHPVLRNHLILLKKIKDTFSSNDKIFLLKAPGRVNLIGEHTDYNMGPVLPCAINKEIVFCIRPSGSQQINAVNAEEKFEQVSFTVKEKIEPYSRGSWGNYIKAGVKGILDFLESSEKSKHRISDLKGFDVVVSSTLPQAAGVSSSSALVVAAALAFVVVNHLDLDKQKIAAICAKAEHFVGTSGGGMDQAASLLGKENSFLYMEFNPLRITEIPAPKDLQLILFNSLIQAEKGSKSRLEYNRRVLECRIAVELFNRFAMSYLDKNYQQVTYIGEIKPGNLNLNQAALDKMVTLFINDLADNYSLEQVKEILALTEKEFNDRYLAILQHDDLQKEFQEGLKIKSRFKHVYYECHRVHDAINCLRNNNLNELGHLINQSHNSLAQDYEVSIPEIDDLVEILRENGAMGARIMGAGFGGMVLALVPGSQTDQIIEAVRVKYYSGKVSETHSDNIFPCVVADGAGLL